VARRTGARLLGVDFSPVALELARARVRRVGWASRAEYREGDMLQLPVDDSSVDAALCVAAIFFCGDVSGALQELNRVIRPGGRLGLFTVDRDSSLEGPLPTDTPALTEGVGFRTVSSVEPPGWRETFRGIYDSWLAHEQQLRVELGDEAADPLIQEAVGVGGHLEHRRLLVILAERPS
jgi:ubiquinone/menaquinone biosynthesis C-methylase UbiE